MLAFLVGLGASSITPTFDSIAPCVTRGNVLYRGASIWSCLANGSAGAPFVSNGVGADPSYGVFRYFAEMSAGTTTPVDAHHTYIGGFYGSAAADNVSQVATIKPCEVAATIVSVRLQWFLTTAGDAAVTSVLLVKNGSTAATLNGSQTWNQTALTAQNENFTGLSVACTTDDQFEIDINGAAQTWATTNPTGLWRASIGITIP